MPCAKSGCPMNMGHPVSSRRRQRALGPGKETKGPLHKEDAMKIFNLLAMCATATFSAMAWTVICVTNNVPLALMP